MVARPYCNNYRDVIYETNNTLAVFLVSQVLWLLRLERLEGNTEDRLRTKETESLGEVLLNSFPNLEKCSKGLGLNDINRIIEQYVSFDLECFLFSACKK